ncbi:MAG TPA: site-2 protease family protein [Humibacter sp.]|nr:site-2 protease family protein [Humibacter sp.]
METVLLFVLGILIFLVGLALSIALHELGHLSFAKLFGVKVTQYMIGFGKTVFSLRRGETEYGVKLLPLGGYISMIGMFPPKHEGERARNASTGFYNSMVQDARDASADTVAPGEDGRTFYRLAPWKRIIVMFAGPFMNLVIAFVLFAVILMGIGIQTRDVGSVSPCVPSGATATTCSSDAPPSPAKLAGFRPGDLFVSIDGRPTPTWDDATAVFQRSAGRTLSVVVDNEGVKRSLTVTPVAAERAVVDQNGKPVVKNGLTQTRTVGTVGIISGAITVRQPVTAVIPAFGNSVAQVAGVVIDLPQRMVGVWNAAFGSGPRQADGPVGIIGVGRVAGDVASDAQYPVVAKVQTMLSLLASLNIALFVFNMIPLLPLDGGHIVGAVWEWIKRAWAKALGRREPRPVDMARLMPVTFAVIVVLGAMSLLLAYADIVKPITLG